MTRFWAGLLMLSCAAHSATSSTSVGPGHDSEQHYARRVEEALAAGDQAGAMMLLQKSLDMGARSEFRTEPGSKRLHELQTFLLAAQPDEVPGPEAPPGSAQDSQLRDEKAIL